MEIKKCPCCGGQADILDEKLASLVHKYGIQCAVCGLRTPTFWNEKRAYEIWNRRLNHDEIAQVESNHEIMGYTK